MGVYILRPHAAGILYAPPPFYTPPNSRRVFSGVGGWGCIKFGPVLVAGDSAICGRLAALILRLRPAGLRFEEFRSPVKRGGLGLRFSTRSGLRPAAI